VDVALADPELDGGNSFGVARLPTDGVPAARLISTHSGEDFQGLIAGSPARGFLHKSPLCARALQEVPAVGKGTRSRPGVGRCWASGVVGTWSTRFNAGELGALNDGVRM
jgi:hypothetical protein